MPHSNSVRGSWSTAVYTSVMVLKRWLNAANFENVLNVYCVSFLMNQDVGPLKRDWDEHVCFQCNVWLLLGDYLQRKTTTTNKQKRRTTNTDSDDWNDKPDVGQDGTR